MLNATSNLGGLLLFIIGGKVIWATGFVMMVGQFFGARMGSRLVLSKGQQLIRPNDCGRLSGDERQATVRQPWTGNSSMVRDQLMTTTHDYQQLISIFDGCFAEEFNTRLIKGDDEPIYLPADAEVPYNRIVFAPRFLCQRVA
ncbi:Protein of uncharacterised function, DUF462 [Kluyvera intermedia]|nr:Protein of uncharacterised function, DUF462 [Kluyvera intermedia]